MFPAVDTKDVAAVEKEVQATYLGMFPKANRAFVGRSFSWAIACFTGNYKDYLPIDARYHDFEHTLQGTLCMVRMLQGRHQARGEPLLTQRVFELGLLAILLHDTGYLKHRGDDEGTGAKYTLSHVTRSGEFAEELLWEKRFKRPEIHSVQHMIRCTGVNFDLLAIPFQSELERTIGYALGTADLLGQMSAPDYVDKLPILYTEFVEAAQFSGKMPGGGHWSSAEELMRNTAVFWDKYVRVKIAKDFCGLYRYLERPYPGGPNEYVDRIEANVGRLRQRFGL